MEQNKKITIYDIAEITGFSITTINRALNNRGRINKDTQKIILETAEKLGYRANPAAQGLSRKSIKLGAILFCPVNEYIDDIRRGIEAASYELKQYNVDIDLRTIPYTDDKECCSAALELLEEFNNKKYNGVLLTPNAEITEVAKFCEPIEKMEAAGIPVVTISNDIPDSKRLFHVGIDAFTAGKMAAELLRLTSKGRDVAILTYSAEAEIHRQYLSGFMDFAGEGVFQSIRVYSHHDIPELVIKQTEQMLQDNPALHAVYMPSASSVLACKHLRSLDIKGLNIITTDLLDETPALLNDNTAFATIYQDPYRQGKTAAMLLYDHLIYRRLTGNPLITPIIVCASNHASYRNWKDTLKL